MVGLVVVQLFCIEVIFGVVCGVLLFVLLNQQVWCGSSEYCCVCWIVVVMVVCVLVGYFVLQLFMNVLCVVVMDVGIDIVNLLYVSCFGMLYGVLSVFYFVESVLGLMLIWCLLVCDV